MNFLGIDLSAVKAGVVFLDESGRVVSSKFVETPRKSRGPTSWRVHLMLKSLKHYLVGERIQDTDWCALEEPAYGAHPMAYHLGMSFGCVQELLISLCVNFFFVNPISLKEFVTANSRATKQEMKLRAIDAGVLPGALEAAKCRGADDIADAWGLANIARVWAIYYLPALSAWLGGTDPCATILPAHLSHFLPANQRLIFERTEKGRAKGLIHRPERFAAIREGLIFGVRV